MTGQHIMQDEQPHHDEMSVADDVMIAALDELARPLGRSALSVITIAVAEALTAVGETAEPAARRRESESQTRLTPLDRDSSLLARLLATNPEGDLSFQDVIEIGDGQTARLPWCITPRSNSITLGLIEDQLGDRGDLVLTTVAGLTRALLQYLTEPGKSSRWADPLPGDLGRLATDNDPPVPESLRQRWRERQEQEAAAAIALLVRWLRLDELPAEGMPQEKWWEQLQMTTEVHGLLATWCRWLGDRGVLVADEDLLRVAETAHCTPRTWPGSWERPVENIAAALAAHETLVRQVLTGTVASTDLLSIPDLRPGHLTAAEPDLMPVWHQIGDLLLDRAGQLSHPLELVDLGGASRENPHLDMALERAGVSVTIRQAGRPRADEATFDAVLAVGSLHRWADPEDAVRTVSELLRPGGFLVAVENTELSPLGLLIAGLIENGFTDATGAPIDEPTQDAATWRRLLNAAGLLCESTPVGPSPAVFIRAERTSASASQLLETGNKDIESGPICTRTENEVAQLWSQLLQATPQDRADSFFELGGDSLRATRFIAAVKQRYGVTIAMRELFARPALAAVAQRIDAAISESGNDALEEGVL